MKRARILRTGRLMALGALVISAVVGVSSARGDSVFPDIADEVLFDFSDWLENPNNFQAWREAVFYQTWQPPLTHGTVDLKVTNVRVPQGLDRDGEPFDPPQNVLFRHHSRKGVVLRDTVYYDAKGSVPINTTVRYALVEGRGGYTTGKWYWFPTSRVVRNLMPGKHNTGSVISEWPRPLYLGHYFVYACVDQGKNIDERIEWNNCRMLEQPPLAEENAWQVAPAWMIAVSDAPLAPN